MCDIAQLIESDGPGGAERVVAELATHLQESGAQTSSFVPADGEGWLARELAGCGVAVEPFHLDRPFSPACARSMAAAFRRHRIDIAHSHEFTMAVYGAWASWLAGVPTSSRCTAAATTPDACAGASRCAPRWPGATRVVAVSHQLWPIT